MVQENFFRTEKPIRLLMRLAPPVMLAQLIQALYNIIDSYFIGLNSTEGLAALSIIFPIQLLISAIAVGTGVGVNAVMARCDGESRHEAAEETAGTGLFLAIAMWLIFAVISLSLMGGYCAISLSSQYARECAHSYGTIICGGSLFLFLESNWTKVLQARGDMRTPMAAQIIGAVSNVILDWLLIFGIGIFPKMGVAGAALASVIGQGIAAGITGKKGFFRIPKMPVIRRSIRPIYRAGIPNIIMNALCTFYVVGLNLILVTFSDEAVTVLGLYYKLQTFFLLPVLSLATCIIPLVSFNKAAGESERCRQILMDSMVISFLFLVAATFVFEVFPIQLLQIFTHQASVLQIGEPAFRIIGASFLPIALSLIIPMYFQATGHGMQSITISVLRQIILLVPLAWIFSQFGLIWFWVAFPISELVAAIVALLLYRRFPI